MIPDCKNRTLLNQSQSHTYVQFGQAIDVVQQRCGGAVNERFHNVLCGHAGEDFLLGPQTNVARLERIVGHNYMQREWASDCVTKKNQLAYYMHIYINDRLSGWAKTMHNIVTGNGVV